VNPLLKSQKIGFIGAGNMAQAMIKGMLEAQLTTASHLYVANRTPGKLQKLSETFKVNVSQSNEELIEKSDIVILAVKPQDLLAAIEPVAHAFLDQQIVISLAAGVRMQTLEKHLPQCRVVRLMPNTPSIIGRGTMGYFMNEPDAGLETMVEDLFTPLGSVMKLQDEDQFEAFMIACSSGTGFVYELMMYWQDWIEEHGFDTEVAKQMTIETFLGAAELALKSQDLGLEELQSRVTSKKGVTAAGLESMRELEIERALRVSFEKAALRNKEMARLLK